MSHKFKQGLLLNVMLNFTLENFNVLLLRPDSVLVHFAFKLHAWEHLFGIDLKVLQLLNNTSVFLFLGKTHQFIIQTNVLKTRNKL